MSKHDMTSSNALWATLLGADASPSVAQLQDIAVSMRDARRAVYRSLPQSWVVDPPLDILLHLFIEGAARRPVELASIGRCSVASEAILQRWVAIFRAENYAVVVEQPDDRTGLLIELSGKGEEIMIRMLTEVGLLGPATG